MLRELTSNNLCEGKCQNLDSIAVRQKANGLSWNTVGWERLN